MFGFSVEGSTEHLVCFNPTPFMYSLEIVQCSHTSIKLPFNGNRRSSKTVLDHTFFSRLVMQFCLKKCPFHHILIAYACAGTFVYYTALAPFLGLRRRPEATKHAEKVLMQSLARIESVWLKGDAKFLLGSPQPSIADLSLVCEIMQLEVCTLLISKSIVYVFLVRSSSLVPLQHGHNTRPCICSIILLRSKCRLQCYLLVANDSATILN